MAQGPQASVSLKFLPHFDVSCDLLLKGPTATWNLFVLNNDQKSIKTDIHTCIVPFDCSRIYASLGIFKSQCYFTSRLLFFSILLLYIFFEKFFNDFTCSKQNEGENILQNSESFVAMTHDGNCCEVVKNYFCFLFSIFLLCK